jgi:hypothetical protein
LSSPGGTCQAAQARLLAFYARELTLDELHGVVRHLDGCADCGRLFTDHGRRFRLVQATFAEFIDGELGRAATTTPALAPLRAPVDIAFLAAAEHYSGRLALSQPVVRTRFRGHGAGGAAAPGGRASHGGHGGEGAASGESRATATLGPIRLRLSWSVSAPGEVQVDYSGDSAPPRITARCRWTDGSTAEIALVRGKPLTIPVPRNGALAGLDLEEAA